jgi:hypothetical protein
MFQLYVTNVSSIFSYVHCKCFISMLHMFHTYVASVLSGCCVCLQWFSGVFKCFASISDAYCRCFSFFVRMLKMFLSECFKSILACCTCCNVTHPATTAYCSSLGAVHARGGAEGWSAAPQRAREAGGQAVPAWHAGVASEGGVGVRIEAVSVSRNCRLVICVIAFRLRWLS